MRPLIIIVAILLVGACLSPCVSADTRFVLHAQGFVTPAQNFYFHLFQFTDPSETVGLLGYARSFGIPGGSALGLAWLKADSDGDTWTGLGFWPTLNLSERLAFSLDSRYLLGWGDTLDQIQLIPWFQYRLDDRNSIRLQGSLTENQGDGVSGQWSLGPFWIYHIDASTQVRLGYQQALEGEPNPSIVLGYVVNL